MGLACSSQGVLLSIRLYERDASARVPGPFVFEQLESSFFQDDGIAAFGEAQFRIVRVNICGEGDPLVLHNPGPLDKRIWLSFWGESCLTLSSWGACYPQLALEPPTALRCGVPLSCPSGQAPNAWTHDTALALTLPNCPQTYQIWGRRLDIFSDGFESGSPDAWSAAVGF
jgi:hypothetical protein